jgi:2,3-bisphosphoglycerate-dependent phosphoglycerate mutase
VIINFIRHGESEANLIREFSNRGWKHGLTTKGFQQAHNLAQTFTSRSIAMIYTSPLKRAVETAHVLAQFTGAAVEINDALREFDTGINEGQRDPESWLRWEEVMYDWRVRRLDDSRIEGGESLTDLLSRFVPFVDRIRSDKNSGSQEFILVGHGGLYFSILPRILVNISYADIENLDFPNTGIVYAEDTSDGLVCRSWCGVPF